MNWDDSRRLDEVKNLRAQNNNLWMEIVYIALREAPEETKRIMRGISEKDSQINEIWLELSK